MMNYIWAFLLIISTVFALMSGRADVLTQSIAESGKTAIDLFAGIFGVMILWSGLMNIAEKSGLTAAVAKILRPLLRFLFPDVKKGSEAEQLISMNLCAELMGLGNAATPIGLRAMKALSKTEGKNGVAGRSMIMLVVLNTASIQLIPTTVGALRASLGSAAPFSIIPPVWVTSLLALIVVIIAAKVLERVWPRA